MPEFQAYTIAFNAPLLLTQGTDSLSPSGQQVYSDTLKSAMFVCALRLGLVGEGTKEEGKAFFDNFQISSLFPKIGGTYYFPAPADLGQRWQGDMNPTERKKVKKIKWLEKSTFEKLLCEGQLALNMDKIQGSFYGGVSNKEQSIYRKLIRARAQIPAQDSGKDTKPYDVESHLFDKDYKHYFLVKFENEEYKTILESALKLLADEGIGADRTVGHGIFNYEGTESLNLKTPETNCSTLYLGNFCPESKDLSEEAFKGNAAFKVIRRGGWVASPSEEKHLGLHKKFLYMLEHGSILDAEPRKIKGQLHNLRQDFDDTDNIKHPIWREGRTIELGIKTKKDA